MHRLFDPLANTCSCLGLIEVAHHRKRGDALWARPSYDSEISLPRQGFKLHITATVRNAPAVLRVAAPLLLDRETPFKTVCRLRTLQDLNAGTFGYTQIGKAVTVYPRDEQELVDVAARLRDALLNVVGPRVPSDRPLPGSRCIFYRYGSFEFSGEGKSAPLIGLDGSRIADSRRPGQAIPAWVRDPFALGTGLEVRTRLLHDRFVCLDVLRLRGKGIVFRALDFGGQLPQRCVVKQAHAYGDMEPDGIEARDRLRWEASILCELTGDDGFARVRGLFEAENGDLVLSLEDAGPRSLHELLLAGGAPSRDQVLAWARQLARALMALHARDAVCVDLSADNVVLGPSGDVSIVDLERVWRVDGPPATIGTPGFVPPRSKGRAPLAADDCYALGALCCWLLAPELYRDHVAGPHVPLPDLPAALGARICGVLKRAISDNPSARFASAGELSAALTG